MPDFKPTLQLPDPDFSIPMKANLPTLEPRIQAKWADMDIYRAIQRDRANAEVFSLHDGPPYTNSPIHMGTAFNKILKDFVVKSQTMMGKRAPFVPGYDNHGLPIEMAVQKKLAAEGKGHPDVLTLRKACREHAEHYIGVQTEQFMRLGVFGTWDKPYTSMGFAYEAEIVRVFRRLVEGGYVYRGLRPVLWSPTSRTALADTEIIYKDHTSTAIYVRFALKHDAHGVLDGLSNVYTIIWTTTPWTIPANLGVAFHPHLEYEVVRSGEDHYIVLAELREKTFAACGLNADQVVKTVTGLELERSTFAHPAYGRDSLAMVADYVTTEDGTGVVHTAPGHGREDFMTGQKYGLPVLCPVDEKGVLTEEAGEFAGTYYKKCDEVVVNRLVELGALLHSEPYYHSYPHAERDEQPVIFRATEQWFIGIDRPFHLDPSRTLRQKMLQEIDLVKWHPANSIGRIRAMIENRPDWCISRQRPWGVGIPVFYGAESGQPVLDPVAIEAAAQLIEREGSDAWYARSAEEILPAGYAHPSTGETTFRKEVDVFDVWFDSGSTHLAVLEGKVEPEWQEELPCDLFLEGTDQHRGWFNVSLILGVACRGHRPYKQVATHGFLNDEKGQKMSKRLGNVIDPVAESDRLGADVLRVWSASVNFADDEVPVGPGILGVAGETYRSFRNTLRFLLANLADYDPESDHELSALDLHIMQETDRLVERVFAHWDEFQFQRAMAEIHHFCVNDLSKLYLDAIKDTMYCDAPTDPRRRGAQRACHAVLMRLVTLLAPTIPHTAEEVYERIPAIDRKFSVHAECVPAPAQPYDSELAHQMRRVLEVRGRVFAQLEHEKANLSVKNSQEVEADLSLESEDFQAMEGVREDMANLFKMADVRWSEGAPSITFRKTEYAECARSRVRRADVTDVEYQGETVWLSRRDRLVLGLESSS
jgi:isoleucyl-tRNA synthetase